MTRSRTRPVHGRPSPLKAWVRTHKIPAALISALVLVLAIGIGVAVSMSSGGRTTATTSASVAPPRHRAGPVFILPETAPLTKGAKWLTGPAGKLLTAVNADIGRLSIAERAGKQGAAKIAGTQLATDAEAALDGPMPPVDAKVYQSALEDFVRAGTSTASGDFSQATPLLNVGNLGITEVTSAVIRPAAQNGPTAANEGAGQLPCWGSTSQATRRLRDCSAMEFSPDPGALGQAVGSHASMRG